MDCAERWALALLALSGAVFLPSALNRFVFPKLTCVAVAVALAATVPARGRLPRAAVGILSAGTVVLVLAALLGPAPVSQLVGRAPRYEGAFVLALYVGAGVAGARLLGPGRARGSTAWFLRCLAVASILVAIEAVLETAGLHPLASSTARPGSLLGNASDEGAWAVLVLGPLAGTWLRAGGRWLLAGAVAAGATLVCSGSRGALAGALVVVAGLALLTPSRSARIALAAGVACMLVATFAVSGTRTRVLGTDRLASHTVSGRTLLWGETASLLSRRPVLGVGPNGYRDTIPAYHSAHYERVVGPANPPDSPHNWLLQAAVDGGVVLLALALGLVVLTFRRGWTALASQPSAGERAAIGGVLAGLAGYGTALLFHFTSPGTTPLAAVFGGALLAGPADAAAATDWAGRTWRRVRSGARRAAVTAFAVIALVMAAGAAAEIALRSAIVDASSGRLSAAESRFRLARDLRPWDDEIDATAGHAFATLAGAGDSAAIGPAEHWVSKEVSAYPDSVQAKEDQAILDLAQRRFAAAVGALAVARRLEPANAQVAQLQDLERRMAGR
jgi:O-antigen ligase